MNASSQAKYPPSFTLQIQLPQAPAPPNVVGARTASPTVRITFSLVLRLFSIPEGRCHLDAECIQCTPELRWGSSSHAPRIYCAQGRVNGGWDTCLRRCPHPHTCPTTSRVQLRGYLCYSLYIPLRVIFKGYTVNVMRLPKTPPPGPLMNLPTPPLNLGGGNRGRVLRTHEGGGSLFL